MSDKMNKFAGNGETIIDEHGVETIIVGIFNSNAAQFGSGSKGGRFEGGGGSTYKPSLTLGGTGI